MCCQWQGDNDTEQGLNNKSGMVFAIVQENLASREDEEDEKKSMMNKLQL